MNKCISYSIIAYAALIVAVSEGIAQDQNLEGLFTKLNRLERDIQALNRRVYMPGRLTNQSSQGPTVNRPVGNSAYIARSEGRLSQIEDGLQNTTNLIESISHKVDEMKDALDKVVRDINFRLSRLEGGLARTGVGPAGSPRIPSLPNEAVVQQIGPSGGGPVLSAEKLGNLGRITEGDLSASQQGSKNTLSNGTGSPGISSAHLSILPKGTPSTQYHHAFSFLRRTEYDKAELAFKEFIVKNPKDALTPSARYWLGQSFYVRGRYRDSAEAFLLAYQQAPKGSKAPNTLLKLGMSLANLEKKQDACATFRKLSKDYPNASGNIKKRLKKEIGRAGCK